ncbi:MAG: hypothetical protein JSR77_15585 [Planctomycetes bacterium]|nr:hypothetical protein [Planctomycetota bacterium]
MKRSRLIATSVLVALAALCGCASHGGTHEENETAVSMNEVPAAVRATLERESAGGKVTEIEKEMKDGKTIYSADVEIKGVAWDISVAEDGTVISKEKE